LCGDNFSKAIRICADRLWSGLRLSKVWDTLDYRQAKSTAT
jgi:hypothetical protein